MYATTSIRKWLQNGGFLHVCKRQQTDANSKLRPPKAKVTRSNRVGCATLRLSTPGYPGAPEFSSIVTRAEWRNPEDVKASYPKASILKVGRVVFNIKGNDYRLIARVQYQAGVLMIRFFGTHAEYDKIDAESV
jgi:mRNA-degrading endonuclease HigB of HigAB toxin-antitoxin module